MKVLLDCDPGIDDALALLLALASPEIDLIGVTTVAGNASVEDETDNALALLAMGRRSDVPVAMGCARPLIKPLITAADTHGPTGMGYATLPSYSTRALSQHAVDFIIEQVQHAPGEITVVAVGPLTNLALAIRKAPEIIPLIKQMICMGGAIHHPGNMPLSAEFNVWVDPHAAHIVYHSGLPITLVPLDVTYQCIWTHAHTRRLQAMAPQSPISQFVADATRFYIEFHQREQNIDGCAINDALAMALLLAPDLVQTQPLYVDVALADGPAHAMTIADPWQLSKQPSNMQVALKVDAMRFLELFLTRLVASHPPQTPAPKFSRRPSG